MLELHFCVNFVQYFQDCIRYRGLHHASAFPKAYVTFPELRQITYSSRECSRTFLITWQGFSCSNRFTSTVSSQDQRAIGVACQLVEYQLHRRLDVCKYVFCIRGKPSYSKCSFEGGNDSNETCVQDTLRCNNHQELWCQYCQCNQ